MKNKGIVFSLSVLLLVLSFVLLQQATTRASIAQSQAEKSNSMFRNLNEHYAGLASNTIELDTKSSYGKIQQRTLPFMYKADQNYLELSYKTPLKHSTIGNFFDLINAFKIFVQDKNYSDFYNGINTQADTIENSNWGGTQTGLNFITEPSCMQIFVDENGITFGKGWCGQFDLNQAALIDSNISVYSPTEDLNKITCMWNENNSCPDDPFDTTNPNPYYSLQILDQNCSECAFSAKTVNGHIDISKGNWIAVSCDGTSCTSPQIDINVAQNYSISRNENALPVQITTGIMLKNKITAFYFNDLNITVSGTDYNISMVAKK
jgi:hypothetical protein